LENTVLKRQVVAEKRNNGIRPVQGQGKRCLRSALILELEVKISKARRIEAKPARQDRRTPEDEALMFRQAAQEDMTDELVLPSDGHIIIAIFLLSFLICCK
jgi:hypothetical protein